MGGYKESDDLKFLSFGKGATRYTYSVMHGCGLVY